MHQDYGKNPRFVRWSVTLAHITLAFNGHTQVSFHVSCQNPSFLSFVLALWRSAFWICASYVKSGILYLYLVFIRSVVSNSLRPLDCCLPGSSVHGILQARILEWVAIFLLQRIFPIQGLNPGLPHCRKIFLPSEPPDSISHLTP